MSIRFLPGILLTLFAPAAFAASDSASDLPARMDAIVQTYVADQRFMGTVLAAHADKVIFTKSYGSANLELNVPNTRTTKFRIGSITKQFTAACILLLEERGKLTVEDPIGKYYAEAPAAWSKVTLAHLLQHTSGIHSYTDDPTFDTFTKLPATPESLVARQRDKPLDFETGTQFRYSNTGYILLGMVIEQVSGQKYADFVRANVLEPLGMKDTGYDVNATVLPQRAAGYSLKDGKIQNSKYLDMTVPYAAGSLYSTVDDLLRWERALFGKKLLSAASLAKMTTPGDQGKKDYAFGLLVTKKGSHLEIQHGGGIHGFNAQLTYLPESDYVVVALSNLNGPVDKLVEEIATLLSE
jgi:CubicO group peptidase (beta-lactamase class C family)